MTAVEWLIAELERRLVIIKTEPDGNVRETMINNFLIDADQAKAMERQQIEEAWKNASPLVGDFKKNMAEDYYNEKYKQ